MMQTTFLASARSPSFCSAFNLCERWLLRPDFSRPRSSLLLTTGTASCCNYLPKTWDATFLHTHSNSSTRDITGSKTKLSKLQTPIHRQRSLLTPSMLLQKVPVHFSHSCGNSWMRQSLLAVVAQTDNLLKKCVTSPYITVCQLVRHKSGGRKDQATDVEVSMLRCF